MGVTSLSDEFAMIDAFRFSKKVYWAIMQVSIALFLTQ